MRIEDVNLVLSVALHSNMTKAAAESYVAVPTLSEAVKRVERELGITIFNRSNRGVTLTPDGRRILDHLRSLAEADVRLRTAALGPLRNATFTVGSPQTAWSELLHYADQRSRTGIRFRPANIDHYSPAQQLLSGSVDLALLPAPSDFDSRLQRKPLFYEPRLVSVSSSSPLAETRSARLEDFDRLRWLGAPPGADQLYTATHRCDDIRGGRPKRLGRHVSHPMEVLAAIRSGELIVGTSRSFSRMFNLTDGRITDVEISGAPPWQVDLVWCPTTGNVGEQGFEGSWQVLREAVDRFDELLPTP